MSEPWVRFLLHANLAAQACLIAGALWCIAFPSRRFYPMTAKNAWYYAMWSLFGLIFASNAVFVVVDWNSGLWTSALRFWLGVPVTVAGGAFVCWGIATLGVTNTSALRDRFVVAGPYLICRNPQYVGDGFLFAGIAILANSQVVLVTNLLTAFLFILAPLAEEPWLERQYGQAYTRYRESVPRFL
jgi:protein-S-isoprenylcysteine O-methyltransferase Ste14